MSLPPLRALHLLANFKWTGPADPAIRQASGLRRAGVDVVFAQAARVIPGVEHRMALELKRLRIPVTQDLLLPKHYGPLSALRDAFVLKRRLRRGDFNLLHGHLRSDHITASLAKRLTRGPVTLVRSLYEPKAPRRNLRNLFAFGNTDGVVAPTRACAQQMARYFGLGEERVLHLEPATDLDRFPKLEGDLRGQLGLERGHVAVGITARIQPHRRFDLLWQTARRALDRQPELRFVLLGRGSEEHVESLVTEPLARLGLGQKVIHPGYLQEPEYSLAIKSLDIFMFLVPGSDGTCRAVREAMAAGLPVVSSKRGILPELLGRRYEGPAQDPCGLLMDEEPKLMAEALLRLVRQEETRRHLGQAALRRAQETMDPAKASSKLHDFYGFLQENPR